MNKNTENTEIILRPEQEAVVITERIKANGRAAVNAVCNIGKDLRRMKIEGLFVHLGYESFEDYAEKEFDLKRRQAYLYISVYEKLGEEFVQSNAQLGITKLSMLTQIDAEDRGEIMDNNDVAGMTAKELDEILAKYKEQGDQLSMLQEENETIKREAELDRKEQENANEAAQRFKALYKKAADDVQRLEDNEKSLREQLNAEKQKTIDLEGKIETLEAEPKDVQVVEKEVIKEVPDKKAIEKKDKEIAKLKKEVEKLSQNYSAKEKERAEQQSGYEAQIAELKKAAEKPPENPDKASFKSMFASVYKEMAGVIELVKSAESKDKPLFISKVKQLLEASEKALKEVEVDEA